MPREMVVSRFERVRELGCELITLQYVQNAVMGTEAMLQDADQWLGEHSTVGILPSYRLLNSDIPLSHANGTSESDAKQLSSAGAHISSTPITELQMALGTPVCFRPN